MSKKAKNVLVTRAWLLDLANSIYNPKTKKFLRLCDGTLQNGSDPSNKKRTMHCGIGELYFAMTGLQPHDTGVCEDDVIQLALLNSTLAAPLKEATKSLKETIQTLNVSASSKSNFIENLDCEVVNLLDNLPKGIEFKNILDNIPAENDDGCGNACYDEVFKERSERVAKILRQAAKVLPA